VTNLEIANRFFAALLTGDGPALNRLFAPGAIFWQNFDGREIPRAEFLPGWAGLATSVTGLRIEDVRRTGTPTGFVEQHTLAGTTTLGESFAIHGCFIATVADGRITRLNEYLDSAERQPLVAARAST
jgi:uncharacterized protein